MIQYLEEDTLREREPERLPGVAVELDVNRVGRQTHVTVPDRIGRKKRKSRRKKRKGRGKVRRDGGREGWSEGWGDAEREGRRGGEVG